MSFLNLILSLSILNWPESEQRVTRQSLHVPEVFFSLRTYDFVMYNGMETYICDEVVPCGQLDELDTSHGLARLKDGRYMSLRRRTDPARSNRIGTLEEVSGGRLSRWPRIASVSPRTLPQIPDHAFVRAYQVVATDAYVGLWHRSGRGPGTQTPGTQTPGTQTIVVLFDGGNLEGSGLSPTCGPYRILASVNQRVDNLEVRPIHHVGEAVNLASYDPRSRAIWVARMILPETALNCR
jgi:hypothetical protein